MAKTAYKSTALSGGRASSSLLKLQVSVFSDLERHTAYI